MMAFVMSDVRNPSVQNVYAALLGSRESAIHARSMFYWGQSQERTFLPGGHDNPLKRLIPDKEIQGNQSFFSW
jgi:hypothetical protein